jgi:hypothetical protein
LLITQILINPKMSEQPGTDMLIISFVLDAPMTDEQQKAVDESLALAKQLEEEELKEAEKVIADHEAEQTQGESISGYVNQEYAK